MLAIDWQAMPAGVLLPVPERRTPVSVDAIRAMCFVFRAGSGAVTATARDRDDKQT